MCGGFITEWIYEQTLEIRGMCLHVWSCLHHEGYTAYQLTHQPKDPRVSFVKPQGSAHWVTLEGLSKNQCIPMELLSGCKERTSP
jgi:hypothetical protein